jgi:Lrp/AsnC family leucine-responsive transcriptional regulator
MLGRMAVDDIALDSTDRRILSILREEGRVAYRELAERVQLSPNATADRVRRLERRGVIRGYRADVDLEVLGRTLVALVDVRLPLGADNAAFEAAALSFPAVIEALHVTGDIDYELRVACRDVAELDTLLTSLRTRHGAASTETRLVLHQRVAPLTFDPKNR